MERFIRTCVFIAAVLLAVFRCSFASGQKPAGEPEADSFPGHFEIGGVVELSASYEFPYEGGSNTATAAGQLELGVGVELHKWIGTEVNWIHEHEDEENREDEGYNLGFFTATVVIGPQEGWWWLKGGMQFLPFTLFELANVHTVHEPTIGPFKSAAIVDPMSYEYGKKKEKSLQVGLSLGPFEGNVYGYYGDDQRSNDPRAGFGAAVGYRKTTDDESEVAVNLSYIDDLGTLDSFQEGVFEHDGSVREEGHEPSAVSNDESVPGWAAATQLSLRDIWIVGEYMIAQKRFGQEVLEFSGRGSRPSAWMLEAGYGWELAGRPGDIALGYHGSSEAIDLDLPSSRYVAVLNIGLWKEVLTGTFEWVYNRDYGRAYDGTGESSNTYILQLGIAF